MFKRVQNRLFLWFLLFSLIPVVVFYVTIPVAAAVMLRAFVISFVIILILAFLVAKKFSQPLALAASLFWKAARGELNQSLSAKNLSDERGHLLLAYQELMKYLKEIKEFVHLLAQGDFNQSFQARSSSDELGQACGQLTDYTQHISNILRKINEGHSLDEVMPYSNNDILGQTLKNVVENQQLLSERLRETVNHILETSQMVTTGAKTEIQGIEKLLTSAEGTSSSMAEMQASVEEVGMNIEALAASIEATSSSINQMGSSISQVTRNSEKLSEFVETTSGIIAQAVSAMEKVSENAENSKNLSSDTMRDASKGQEAMKKMSESVEAISKTVESATVVIRQLEARSDEIGSVLDVIDEIADQTQLLALNASIIAAQAGEQGRGFAVVADEIKDLANRVSESTKEISRIVKTVQQDSANAVKAMDEGNIQVKEGLKLSRLAGDALEKIILGAQWSANVANDIADAIQEQTAMNQSIENSIQDVVYVATENTRATKEQEVGAARVMEAVAKMTSLADQVHRATIEQTKGAAEVINATEEMSALVHSGVKNTQQLLQATQDLYKQAEMLSDVLSNA
ncbi:methyl-accepting chemotaxis sensory transducer [Candidatus Vecturithrix granuli]|uniref:Methyl-accepting chemotaxis sensory transducer n=1 Tax=Vecturithrix granuli TaxID=1499967 RepID=A0A081C497_VECG1|nr:methyl-accepting chemotaxis sensory transducer [Candidatus Vecturithrix granuli]